MEPLDNPIKTVERNDWGLSAITLFLVVFGGLITTICWSLRNSPGNFERLFFQALILLVPVILPVIFILLRIMRNSVAFSRVFTAVTSRTISLTVVLFLLIIPVGRHAVLNDFIFSVVLAVIYWCWISWCYYFETRFVR
jgi:hypothetical protein